MKKICTLAFFIVFWCNFSSADDLKALNNKLSEIEAKFDACINTKNEKICGDVLSENPVLEVLGNEKFGKLLSSSSCAIGTKCGATNARILSKTLKASEIVLGN